MSFASLPRSSRLPPGRRGFTLLELTIAMTFVALLATGIVLSIATSVNVWQRSIASAELNQEARSVFDLISRDIRSTYLGLDGLRGYFLGEPAGQGEPPFDRVRLTTTSGEISHLALLPDELRQLDPTEEPIPASDFVGIRYQWQPETEDQPAGLYRTTVVAPEVAPPISQLVSPNVSEVRFDYLWGDEWVPEWDAPRRMARPPAAVFIFLTLTDERQREYDFQTTVTIPMR